MSNDPGGERIPIVAAKKCVSCSRLSFGEIPGFFEMKDFGGQQPPALVPGRKRSMSGTPSFRTSNNPSSPARTISCISKV